jgi:hypothetical protein
MKTKFERIPIIAWLLLFGIGCNYNSHQPNNIISKPKNSSILSFIKALELESIDPVNSQDLMIRVWFEKYQDKPVRELLLVIMTSTNMRIKHFIIEMDAGGNNKIISKQSKSLEFPDNSDSNRTQIISVCNKILKNKSTLYSQKERFDGTIVGLEILKEMHYKFLGYKIPLREDDLLCSDAFEFNKLYLIIKNEFDIFPIKASEQKDYDYKEY